MLPTTAFLSSFFESKFVTSASVVSIRPAMLAALVSAVFTTLVGSRMPAFTMSTNSPALAS